MSNDRRSVHYWGARSYNGTLSLLKAPEEAKSKDYIQLMKTAGVQNFRPVGLMFIIDNAPIHRLREVSTWKRENGVSLREWPAHRPEMNPIENVWAYRSDNCSAWKFDSRIFREQFTKFGSKFLLPTFVNYTNWCRIGFVSAVKTEEFP